MDRIVDNGQIARKGVLTMKEKFFDRVGVSGILAFVLIAAVAGLAIAGQPIPDVLAGLAVTAAGFYFGDKARVVAEGADARLSNVLDKVQALGKRGGG